jgi:hypothetical protein
MNTRKKQNQPHRTARTDWEQDPIVSTTKHSQRIQIEKGERNPKEKKFQEKRKHHMLQNMKYNEFVNIF